MISRTLDQTDPMPMEFNQVYPEPEVIPFVAPVPQLYWINSHGTAMESDIDGVGKRLSKLHGHPITFAEIKRLVEVRPRIPLRS